MSFKLYKPGERKGNKDFLARIVVDGQRYEKVLTGCKTESQAHVSAMKIELELRAQAAAPGSKEDVSFREAAALYAKWRGLDLESIWNNRPNQRIDARHILKLMSDDLGRKHIRDVNHADIVAAAMRLYPSHQASSRNRAVIRPASSVLHYAAKNGYCPWLRIEAFEESRPKTRAVTLEVEKKLLNATDGMQYLLLLWLFRHGMRISQCLNIRWSDIDLSQQTYRFYNDKAKVEHILPLDDEVFELLAAMPQEQRAGRLWPWTNRSSVARWLNPLRDKLQVAFSPHQARHTLGTRLNASGAGLKTIMAALGHLDPKSSLRYQTADVDTVRAALVATKRAKAS